MPSTAQTKNVHVRVTPEARDMLKELAAAEQRVPVYTLSILIANAYKELKEKQDAK